MSSKVIHRINIDLCIIFRSIFSRFDSLERLMDDKMKLLFDVANNIQGMKSSTQFSNPNQTNTTDNKHSYLFERVTFKTEK